jgi:hypothetical protein
VLPEVGRSAGIKDDRVADGGSSSAAGGGAGREAVVGLEVAEKRLSRPCDAVALEGSKDRGAGEDGRGSSLGAGCEFWRTMPGMATLLTGACGRGLLERDGEAGVELCGAGEIGLSQTPRRDSIEGLDAGLGRANGLEGVEAGNDGSGKLSKPVRDAALARSEPRA